MEKTILYVDGFNFYYGVTQHWHAKHQDRAGLGWCDFRALLERHFHLGDAQLEIKFFAPTIPVHLEGETPQQWNAEQRRHAAWARAVRTIRDLRVMDGFSKPKQRVAGGARATVSTGRDARQSDMNLAVEILLDAVGPCPPQRVFLLSDDRDLMPVVYALQERIPTPIDPIILLPTRADARNWRESYQGTARQLGQQRAAAIDVESLTEIMLAGSLLPYQLKDEEGEFTCIPEWRLHSSYLDLQCPLPEWRPDLLSDV